MRIPTLRLTLSSLALATAACATQPGAAPSGPRSGASPGPCTYPQGHFLLVNGGFDAMDVKPGEPVALTAQTAAGRFSPPEALPASCRVTWSVEPAGAATVDAAGRLTVPAGTAVGTELIVAVHVNRERGRRLVRVADPQPSPIVGMWRQAGPAECGGAAVAAGDTIPIRELEIRPTGHFSVTYVPFETYRDYWGTYAFDRGTGALKLTVAGGNHVPQGLDLEGTATVEGGRLVLRDLWLGRSPASAASCTVTFGR